MDAGRADGATYRTWGGRRNGDGLEVPQAPLERCSTDVKRCASLSLSTFGESSGVLLGSHAELTGHQSSSSVRSMRLVSVERQVIPAPHTVPHDRVGIMPIHAPPPTLSLGERARCSTGPQTTEWSELGKPVVSQRLPLLDLHLDLDGSSGSLCSRKNAADELVQLRSPVRINQRAGGGSGATTPPLWGGHEAGQGSTLKTDRLKSPTWELLPPPVGKDASARIGGDPCDETSSPRTNFLRSRSQAATLHAEPLRKRWGMMESPCARGAPQPQESLRGSEVAHSVVDESSVTPQTSCRHGLRNPPMVHGSPLGGESWIGEARGSPRHVNWFHRRLDECRSAADHTTSGSSPSSNRSSSSCSRGRPRDSSVLSKTARSVGDSQADLSLTDLWPAAGARDHQSDGERSKSWTAPLGLPSSEAPRFLQLSSAQPMGANEDPNSQHWLLQSPWRRPSNRGARSPHQCRRSCSSNMEVRGLNVECHATPTPTWVSRSLIDDLNHDHEPGGMGHRATCLVPDDVANPMEFADCSEREVKGMRSVHATPVPCREDEAAGAVETESHAAARSWKPKKVGKDQTGAKRCQGTLSASTPRTMGDDEVVKHVSSAGIHRSFGDSRDPSRDMPDREMGSQRRSPLGQRRCRSTRRYFRSRKRSPSVSEWGSAGPLPAVTISVPPTPLAVVGPPSSAVCNKQVAPMGSPQLLKSLEDFNVKLSMGRWHPGEAGGSSCTVLKAPAEEVRAHRHVGSPLGCNATELPGVAEPHAVLECGFYSVRGCRSHQEDAVAMHPYYDPDRGGSLFAVFDGHNGDQTSTFSADYFLEHLLRARQDIRAMLLPTASGAAQDPACSSSSGTQLRPSDPRVTTGCSETMERLSTSQYQSPVKRPKREVLSAITTERRMWGEDAGTMPEWNPTVVPTSKTQDPAAGVLNGGSAELLNSVALAPSEYGSCRGPETANADESQGPDLHAAELVQALRHLDKTLFEKFYVESSRAASPAEGGFSCGGGGHSSPTRRLLADEDLAESGKRRCRTPESHDEFRETKCHTPGTSTGLRLSSHSGSTACVVSVVGRQLYIANLGDSRAVLARRVSASRPRSGNRNQVSDAVTNCECGVHGKPLSGTAAGEEATIIFSTRDHRASVFAKEKKRVESLGCEVAFDRVGGVLDVTRSLGDFKFKSVVSQQSHHTSLFGSHEVPSHGDWSPHTTPGLPRVLDDTPVLKQQGGGVAEWTDCHKTAGDSQRSALQLSQSQHEKDQLYLSQQERQWDISESLEIGGADMGRRQSGKSRLPKQQFPHVCLGFESDYGNDSSDGENKNEVSPDTRAKGSRCLAPAATGLLPERGCGIGQPEGSRGMHLSENAEKSIISNVADVYKYGRVRGGELLVLATDGLWDRMSEEEVIRFVLGHLPSSMLPLSSNCPETPIPAASCPPYCGEGKLQSGKVGSVPTGFAANDDEDEGECGVTPATVSHWKESSEPISAIGTPAIFHRGFEAPTVPPHSPGSCTPWAMGSAVRRGGLFGSRLPRATADNDPTVVGDATPLTVPHLDLVQTRSSAPSPVSPDPCAPLAYREEYFIPQGSVPSETGDARPCMGTPRNTLQSIARKLAEYAMHVRGSSDNITVVIVVVKG